MKKISLKKIAILFSLILLVTTSCNLHIEKRHYRKGYYVEVSHTKKTKSLQQPLQSSTTVVDKMESKTTMVKDSSHVVLKDSLIQIATKPIKIEKPVKLPNKSKKEVKKHPYSGGDHCDIITYTNGTQEEIIVEEISASEIKYKKCNYKDGPSYRISKWKVKKIDMYNGEVYVPQNIKGGTTSDGKPNGAIITSLVMGLIALVCLIIGIVLVFINGGGWFGGLIASAGLAPAGILSLIGLIIGATQMRENAHKLATFAFVLSLVVQVLAIIFTVLMFFI